MNFIDPLGLCGEYVQLPMIPTIGSTQHYELNPTEYMRAVDNGVIGFANGIISLTNSAIGSAQYVYQKGLPTVGKEIVEYLQDMGSNTLTHLKNEWDYFLNTPFDKQLTGALNNVFGPKAAETYTTIGTGVVIGNALSNASVGFNTGKATAATSYIDDAAKLELSPFLKGEAGVKSVIESFEAKGGQIRSYKQVEIDFAGTRIRADAIGIMNGKFYIIEAKNGLGAAFTKNQGIVYPQLPMQGIPVGGNAAAAGFTSGQSYSFNFFLHWLE